MGDIGPMELILILVIVVLLFGAKRLPETAKSVGESLKIFKKSIASEDEAKVEAVEPAPITTKAEAAEPAPVVRKDREL
jgi:sec-independent protein translocase protein TatA